MHRFVIVAMSFALAVACGKGGESEPEQQAPESSKPADQQESPASKPEATGSVAQLDLAPVSDDAMATGAKLNKEGLELHKAKDYAGAVGKYSAALEADPGNLLARYNLACALALDSKHDQALALLEEIKDAGCPACISRVARAVEDSDWKSLHGDARFKEITAGVKVNAPSVEDAAKLVVEAVSKEKAAGARDVLHPRHRIEIEDRSGDEIEKQRVVGEQGFDTVFKNSNPTEMKLSKCDDKCCSFEPAHDDDRSLGTNVKQVCFSLDSGGFRYLSSLVISTEM